MRHNSICPHEIDLHSHRCPRCCEGGDPYRNVARHTSWDNPDGYFPRGDVYVIPAGDELGRDTGYQGA